MTLVFWQNIISPHFSYFLNELQKSYPVILIVEANIEKEREKLGWKIPELNNIQILSIHDVNFNYLDTNYKHFFSGFHSYPKTTIYFKEILKYNKVNIIAEAPVLIGFQKYLKYLKYLILCFFYKKKIDKIYAMGKLGVSWYTKVGFDSEKIYNFQYTINNTERYLRNMNENGVINFSFIGQLIDRKNIVPLIEMFSKLENTNWKLNIIGDGNQLNLVKKTISKYNLSNKILLLGVLPNNLAIEYIAKTTSYLILPSKFDGWGAVVNEALSQGIKVITNTNCGASQMIKSNLFGYVYNQNNNNQLIFILNDILKNNITYSLETSNLIAQEYHQLYQKKIVIDFIKTLN